MHTWDVNFQSCTRGFDRRWEKISKKLVTIGPEPTGFETRQAYDARLEDITGRLVALALKEERYKQSRRFRIWNGLKRRIFVWKLALMGR